MVAVAREEVVGWAGKLFTRLEEELLVANIPGKLELHIPL